MESPFDDINRRREREVPYAEKQRLFTMSADILLAGKSELSPYVDEFYIDTNGHNVRSRSLTIYTRKENGGIDPDWWKLESLGFRQAVLMYWPERSFMGETLYDQFTLYLGRSDPKSYEGYTMKLAPIEESYQINITNRREINKLGVDWLEISRGDADILDKVLSTIATCIDPTLVQPKDF